MSETTVFIASAHLGAGDEDLGRALMLAAIGTLKEWPEPPGSILMMNAGVTLCAVGSKALGDLKALAARGVEILCCGTCLDWFEIGDDLEVGRPSNMAEILGRQANADRVLKL